MNGTNTMTIVHFNVGGQVGVAVCSSKRVLAPRLIFPPTSDHLYIKTLLVL